MTQKVTISDAGPLHYLILIEALHVLPTLFGIVSIPEVVRAELLHPSAPAAVRKKMSELESWMKLEPVPTAQLWGLHAGESAVISMASTLSEVRILMDDRAGRRVARTQNLEVIGTLGLLEVAAERRLVSLPEAISRLRLTNFHIAQAALERALRKNEAGERRE
jgi:predicted nucleic acid-binding protein